MAGITLIQAEAKLALYLSLDEALGVNAEVTIKGITYKRHQLRDIRESISYWNSWVNKLTPADTVGGSVRVRQVIPV
jgi:hypothetical protein